MTISVALAILYQDRESSAPASTDGVKANQLRFLFQLRDDLPTIIYPGVWGLFGGHLEPEETPLAALGRELLEEINYAVASPKFFRTFAEAQVIRHVFSAPLTVAVNELILREGQDLRLLSLAEIRRGSGYSFKGSQVRKIGAIHQRILLDFVAAEQSLGGTGKG